MATGELSRPTSNRDWVGWLRRQLTGPAMRRFAFSNPLTRLIVRARAGALFDLMAGFVYSQIMAAAVALDLFSILRERPLNPAELADRLGLEAEPAARFIKAVAALGLVSRRRDGRVALTFSGMLIADSPDIAAMITHHRVLYRDLDDPVALLRQADRSALGNYWGYAGKADRADGADGGPVADTGGAGLDPDRVAAYSELMAVTQAPIRDALLDRYPFHRHRHILDIGGGRGAFLRQLRERHPAVQATLFDLPPVIEEARAAGASAAGIALVGGDFKAGSLPAGCDIVTLIRVLFDHPDPVVADLLSAIYQALPPGGTLLIAEPLAHTSGAEKATDAYFEFYLLAMGHGRTRSFAEHRQMLELAGFSAVRQLPMPVPQISGLIVAQKA